MCPRGQQWTGWGPQSMHRHGSGSKRDCARCVNLLHTSLHPDLGIAWSSRYFESHRHAPCFGKGCLPALVRKRLQQNVADSRFLSNLFHTCCFFRSGNYPRLPDLLSSCVLHRDLRLVPNSKHEECRFLSGGALWSVLGLLLSCCAQQLKMPSLKRMMCVFPSVTLSLR